MLPKHLRMLHGGSTVEILLLRQYWGSDLYKTASISETAFASVKTVETIKLKHMRLFCPSRISYFPFHESIYIIH